MYTTTRTVKTAVTAFRTARRYLSTNVRRITTTQSLSKMAFAATLALSTAPVQAAPVGVDESEPPSYTSVVVFQSVDNWTEVSPFQIVSSDISAPVIGENRVDEKARLDAEAAVAAKKASAQRVAQNVVDPTSLSENLRLAYDMALDRFGSEAQASAFVSIIKRESGGNQNAVNKSSGACGLVQSLPCSKLVGSHTRMSVAEATALVQTIPAVDQLNWGISYIVARYGDPVKTVAFHNANGYY